MRILYTNRKHDLLDNTAAKSVKHKNKHTSHTVLSVKRVSKHYYHCDKKHCSTTKHHAICKNYTMFGLYFPSTRLLLS